jgi:hypothetical protein
MNSGERSAAREAVRAVTPVQLGVVVGLIVFIVGLLTRTRDVGGDDTVYAMAVEGWLRGRGVADEFFDTYHVLFNPIVAAVTWVIRLVHPEALVLDVGAAVSSFFAGLAAGGLVVVLRRNRCGSWPAALAAGSVAACGGFWSIATRMEVYTLAAAAVVLWLAVCSDSRSRPLAVGLSLGLATLAHAALIVLLVPTVWRFRREPAPLLRSLALGLGIPAMTLAIVFVFDRGVWSPLGWLALILPGESIGYVSPAGAWMAPRALYSLVLWNWYHAVPVLVPAAARVMDVLGSTAVPLAAGLVVAGVWRLVRHDDRLGRLSLVALAAFLPLWMVWDVGNPEHAVAAAPLFGVLLALGASQLPRWWGNAALGALLAILLTVNGLVGAVPQSRSENGRLWITASFVTERVPADAVILAVGADSRLRLGLGYLSGRRIVDLTLVVRSAGLNGRPPAEGLGYWLERAREAPSLWALDEIYSAEGEHWVSTLGISASIWRGAVSRLPRVETFELEADGAVLSRPFRIHEVRWSETPSSLGNRPER